MLCCCDDINPTDHKVDPKPWTNETTLLLITACFVLIVVYALLHMLSGPYGWGYKDSPVKRSSGKHSDRNSGDISRRGSCPDLTGSVNRKLVLNGRKQSSEDTNM